MRCLAFTHQIAGRAIAATNRSGRKSVTKPCSDKNEGTNFVMLTQHLGNLQASLATHDEAAGLTPGGLTDMQCIKIKRG